MSNEAILSAILFLMKLPVASAVFWTTRLEAVFVASTPVFVAVSIFPLPYLSAYFIPNDERAHPLTSFLNFGSV